MAASPGVDANAPSTKSILPQPGRANTMEGDEGKKFCDSWQDSQVMCAYLSLNFLDILQNEPVLVLKYAKIVEKIAQNSLVHQVMNCSTHVCVLMSKDIKDFISYITPIN